MTIRLKDPVRCPDGTITTIAQLLAEDKAKLTICPNFYTRCGNVRTAYFADLVDGSGGWEIGRMAYEYRTKGV